jgi:hypothetical protein
VFAGGESGGLLDADDVVFESEIGVYVFLTLVVAGDDAGAGGESENAASDGVVMWNIAKNPAAEIIEVFTIGFANLSEKEAFETGEALAIIEGHLSHEPKRFAATACAAESDGGGAVREVAEASGGAGRELLRLRHDAAVVEVVHLVEPAAGATGGGGKVIGKGHKFRKFLIPSSEPKASDEWMRDVRRVAGRCGEHPCLGWLKKLQTANIHLPSKGALGAN